MTIVPVQFPPFDIPADKVMARLGYAQGKTQMDPAMKDTFVRVLAEAKQLVQGRQVQASSTIRRQPPDQIQLDPGLVIASRDITHLLDGCDVANGFAVTIGPFLEAKRNACVQAGDITRALILDASGSVAAEYLAALSHQQIAAEAALGGYEVTKRFSPGYGDWSLSAQPAFLAWLGANAIGIRLTPSFQMLPEKSVSAIVGLRPK